MRGRKLESRAEPAEIGPSPSILSRRERGRKDSGFFAAAALNDTCLERRRSLFFLSVFFCHPEAKR